MSGAKPKRPRAYRNGIKSYEKGFWMHQNPYRQRDGSELYERWQAGWLAAKDKHMKGTTQ